MSADKIEKIEDLIVLKEGQKITDHKIKRLTAPGENYGSLMLSLDVTVKNAHGTEEINTVAKMLPPSELMQEVFNIQVTFRKEIAFYKTIVPTLQDFQRGHGIKNVIDFFPKYHGSRLNLNHDDKGKVDTHAALVLENLKVQGFDNLERTEGFDLDATKLILTDMAYLHAVPLALKLQKPDVFEKKVKPFLQPWIIEEKTHEENKRNLFLMTDKIEGLQNFKDKIHKSYKNYLQFQLKPHPREPFATIVHNDCWVNNTMIKLEGGKPIKNKFVDFQVYDYGSPAKDVIFVLFSSVKTDILKQNLDNLIKFYYDKFISVLKELGCGTSQFSFEAFVKEVDFEAKNSQFGHIAWMLPPIFAPRGTVKDISDLGEPMELPITEPLKERFIYFVEEFSRRNWM